MKRNPKKGDAAQRAWAVVQEATGQAESPTPKDATAAKHGRKGAHVRAAKLTPERRSEVARLAAAARWSIKRTGGEE